LTAKKARLMPGFLYYPSLFILPNIEKFHTSFLRLLDKWNEGVAGKLGAQGLTRMLIEMP
jgi:hypothetical protein